MKMKKVICKQCECEFEKEKNKVNESIKREWSFFCSKECLSENRKRRKKIKCKNCGKEVIRTFADIKKSKTNNFFCNRSCSATYNGEKHPKRKKVYNENRFKYCIFCKKELVKTQKKYCNNTCRNNHEYEKFLKKWFDGADDGCRGKNKENKSTYIERYLREKYGNKCQKCGWNEINEYTGKVPLDVHHINGDWKNNKEENLELICLNCHSLTINYRNGEGGQREGRPGKREFYKKHGSSRGVKMVDKPE